MVLPSISVVMVERAPPNGYHQCLCPQGESQMLPASPGESLRSAGESLRSTSESLRSTSESGLGSF